MSYTSRYTGVELYKVFPIVHIATGISGNDSLGSFGLGGSMQTDVNQDNISNKDKTIRDVAYKANNFFIKTLFSKVKAPAFDLHEDTHCW